MNNNSSLTNQELLLHDLQKIPVFKTSDNSYIHTYIYIYIFMLKYFFIVMLQGTYNLNKKGSTIETTLVTLRRSLNSYFKWLYF